MNIYSVLSAFTSRPISLLLVTNKFCVLFYGTAIPWLTIITLMTNPSFDQNFLKNVLILTTIQVLITFHFELHFELCAQSVDFHNTRYWENGKTTYFNPPWYAGGYFRLMTTWPEQFLFISQGACVFMISPNNLTSSA